MEKTQGQGKPSMDSGTADSKSERKAMAMKVVKAAATAVLGVEQTSLVEKMIAKKQAEAQPSGLAKAAKRTVSALQKMGPAVGQVGQASVALIEEMVNIAKEKGKTDEHTTG